MHRREALLASVGIFMCIALLVLILAPEPNAAWNSGARERLADALRELEERILGGDAEIYELTALPLERVGHWREPALWHLVQKYSVEVRWHRRGRYERVVFCPLALCDNMHIDAATTGSVRPQIVMVPIGCGNKGRSMPTRGSDPREPFEPRDRLRAIRSIFEQCCINDVAMLMSDGSIVFGTAESLLELAVPRCESQPYVGH